MTSFDFLLKFLYCVHPPPRRNNAMFYFLLSWFSATLCGGHSRKITAQIPRDEWFKIKKKQLFHTNIDVGVVLQASCPQYEGHRGVGDQIEKQNDRPKHKQNIHKQQCDTLTTRGVLTNRNEAADGADISGSE